MFASIKNPHFHLQILILKLILLRDHNPNTSFYKNPVILATTEVFFFITFVQKAMNTLNILANLIWQIYIFCELSHCKLFLMANKYLLTCLLSCLLACLLACLLTYWLTDWLAGWLAGWMDGWLADWLTDWLTDWRHNRSSSWDPRKHLRWRAFQK